MLKKFGVLSVGVLVSALASVGWADQITSYTYQVTNSTVITQGQSAVIGSQIKTYLKDNGDGTVTFHFENLGSFTDCITEVYFQDGLWLKPPPVITGSNSGVSWEVGANPANLPGGNGVFNTDVYLDSQSQPGNAKGINNNSSSPYVQKDWLDLTFAYVPGKTFADVINGLNIADPASRLEIGFHVTGYASSASVVQYGTTPGPVGSLPAPLPRAAWGGLVLLGLLALGRRTRAAIAN